MGILCGANRPSLDDSCSILSEKQALLQSWAAEKEKLDQGTIQIRLITPANAYGCSDIKKLPLLVEGNRIPLSTTLRQLKELIARHLSISIHLPTVSPAMDECNCALAKDIAARGVWDMLRCREPIKPGVLDSFPREDINTSKDCLICAEPLNERCSRCRDDSSNLKECPLVINAGCDHVFHHDCFVSHRNINCPGGCSTDITQREMVPYSKAGRFLIVIEGKSQLRIFKLDHMFGGTDKRAAVSWSALGDMVQTLLGLSATDNKVMFVANGWKTNETIFFHHSLVIAVCSSNRHKFFGFDRLLNYKIVSLDKEIQHESDLSSVVSSGTVEPHPNVRSKAVAPQSSTSKQTLDIHTITALIGRENLDISLGDLGLHHEAHDDVLNIYAVVRQLEFENTDEEDIAEQDIEEEMDIGKNAVFRFGKQWELPSSYSQTARGYVCFLSSLRIFVSQFDQRDGNSFGEFHQDLLLRDLLELTKFPPVARAFYILLSQRTPLPEDCATVSHCLYELCKGVIPPSNKPDILAQSRRLLDMFYRRLLWLRGTEGQSTVLPALHALEGASLLCSITNEPVLDGVLTTTGSLVERSLALEYEAFVLRKTTSTTFTESIARVDGGSHLERLCAFAGGQFREIVYFKQDITAIAPNNPPLDLGWYKSLDCTGPFAIIAPVDLKSVTAPALTFDSEGFVAVFTGIAPCTLPPVNTALFCPLKGEVVVDTSLITAALARLQEENTHEIVFEINPRGARNNAADGRDPDEIIMICLDVSASMRIPLERGFNKARAGVQQFTKLTRIQVVKQVFDVFIDRTLAYNYSNHIGLITFADDPEVKQAITHVIEDFRASVKDQTRGGYTSVWDSLDAAKEHINIHAEKYPLARKRIICLTDGEDNGSYSDPDEVCRMLQDRTGGYKFFPPDLDSAFAICELETMLSALERPEIPKPRKTSFINLKYDSGNMVDTISRDKFPARKEHPSAGDSFVAIGTLNEVILNKPDTFTNSTTKTNVAKKFLSDIKNIFSKSKSKTSTSSFPKWQSRDTLEAVKNMAITRPVKGLAQKQGGSRLLAEIKTARTNPHPYYDVYVSEVSMAFWKVVMEGPPDTMYAGGTFLMYLDMSNNYPTFAPKAYFVTPILHPNITQQGRICHSIFDRNWTTDTTTVQVLNSIWSLFLAPDMDDPANMLISQKYYTEDGAFEVAVHEHMIKHAQKTREQWAATILG